MSFSRETWTGNARASKRVGKKRRKHEFVWHITRFLKQRQEMDKNTKSPDFLSILKEFKENCGKETIEQRCLKVVKNLRLSATFNSYYCKLVSIKQLCMEPVVADAEFLNKHPHIMGRRKVYRELETGDILTRHIINIVQQLPLLNKLPLRLLRRLTGRRILGLYIILSPAFYDLVTDNVFISVTNTNTKRRLRRNFFKNLPDYMSFMICSWLQRKHEEVKDAFMDCLLTQDKLTQMQRLFIFNLRETFEHFHVEAVIVFIGLYLLSDLQTLSLDAGDAKALQSHRHVYTSLLNYLILQANGKGSACDFASRHRRAWLLLGDVKYMDLCHWHVAKDISRQPIMID